MSRILSGFHCQKAQPGSCSSSSWALSRRNGGRRGRPSWCRCMWHFAVIGDYVQNHLESNVVPENIVVGSNHQVGSRDCFANAIVSDVGLCIAQPWVQTRKIERLLMTTNFPQFLQPQSIRKNSRFFLSRNHVWNMVQGTIDFKFHCPRDSKSRMICDILRFSIQPCPFELRPLCQVSEI